jgi:hypothetical protein
VGWGERVGKGIKGGEGKGRRGPPSKGRIERGGGRGNVASNLQGDRGHCLQTWSPGLPGTRHPHV